jgi:hypothetical protein
VSCLCSHQILASHFFTPPRFGWRSSLLPGFLQHSGYTVVNRGSQVMIRVLSTNPKVCHYWCLFLQRSSASDSKAAKSTYYPFSTHLLWATNKTVIFWVIQAINGIYHLPVRGSKPKCSAQFWCMCLNGTKWKGFIRRECLNVDNFHWIWLLKELNDLKWSVSSWCCLLNSK